MGYLIKRVCTLTLATLLLFTLACGDSSDATNNDQNDQEDTEVHRVELFDIDDGSIIAEAENGQWTPSAFTLDVDGDPLTFGIRYIDQNDDEIALGGTYNPVMAIVYVGNDSLIELELRDFDDPDHEVYIELQGRQAGGTYFATEVAVGEFDDEELIYTSPELDITVLDQPQVGG